MDDAGGVNAVTAAMQQQIDDLKQLLQQQKDAQPAVDTLKSLLQKKLFQDHPGAGAPRGLERQFNEAKKIHEGLVGIFDGVQTAIRAIPGLPECDAALSTLDTVQQVIALLLRRLEIKHAAILAGVRAPPGMQLEMADEYQAIMEPQVANPQDDYVSGKKRLSDVQEKVFTSALSMTTGRKRGQGEPSHGGGGGGGGGRGQPSGGGRGWQQRPQQQQQQQQQQQYPKYARTEPHSGLGRAPTR